MLFDKTVTFFEDVKTAAAPEAAKTIVKTGGSDYSRTFIAAKIPAWVTSLRLTVSTSNSLDNGLEEGELGKHDLRDGKTLIIKDATEKEIAAGLMVIPTPLDLEKYTKVTPAIVGEPGLNAKEISCGITDAVPNGILADFGLETK